MCIVERLSVNDRAQVVYRLKHPFGDATTHVVLDCGFQRKVITHSTAK